MTEKKKEHPAEHKFLLLKKIEKPFLLLLPLLFPFVLCLTFCFAFRFIFCFIFYFNFPPPHSSLHCSIVLHAYSDCPSRSLQKEKTGIFLCSTNYSSFNLGLNVTHLREEEQQHIYWEKIMLLFYQLNTIRLTN